MADTPLIGDFRDGCAGLLDPVHLRGELRQVGVGSKDGAGEGTEVADEVDPVVFLVRAGELVFAELAGGVVREIGEGGETALPVAPLDHADEVEGRAFFG